MALRDHQPEAEPLPRLITFRALAIGTTIAILATIGGSWGRLIVETTRLDQNHLSMAAVFPLLLITLFIAGPLRFSRGELATIFCMPLVTTTMPTYFVGRLIANITVPYYLASPENQWATYYEPLPTYAVLPEGRALAWYFEGLPQGLSIPWDVWLVPMFWWFTAVAAFYGCCLFAMVMLRKQWVRNERIDYPLMQLPLAILEEEQSDGFFRMSMMNQPIFWLGFGLSAAIIAWNIVSYFEPTFPKIPYRGVDVSFGPHFQPMRTYLYPIIIGFGYFIRVDILVGLWLFNVLTNIEVGLLNTFGFKTEFVVTHSTGPLPIGSQSMGAYVAIVAVGLWMARFHLQEGSLSKFVSGRFGGNRLLPRGCLWLCSLRTLYGRVALGDGNGVGLPAHLSHWGLHSLHRDDARDCRSGGHFTSDAAQPPTLCYGDHGHGGSHAGYARVNQSVLLSAQRHQDDDHAGMRPLRDAFRHARRQQTGHDLADRHRHGSRPDRDDRLYDPHGLHLRNGEHPVHVRGGRARLERSGQEINNAAEPTVEGHTFHGHRSGDHPRADGDPISLSRLAPAPDRVCCRADLPGTRSCGLFLCGVVGEGKHPEAGWDSRLQERAAVFRGDDRGPLRRGKHLVHHRCDLVLRGWTQRPVFRLVGLTVS